MKKQNGITLISLIITIIVMLILAGVALSAAFGDNSMISQAIKASEETSEKSQIEEQAIKKASDFVYQKTNLSDPNLSHSGTVPEGAYYANLNTGTFYDTMPETVSDGDTYLYKDYIYLYSSERNGWQVNLATIDTGITSYIPDYPVTDKNQTSYGSILENINEKPIVDLQGLFSNCELLEVSPYIPNTVTDMEQTFGYCKSLKKVINLPTNLQILRACFKNCIALEEIPTLPNNVNDIGYAFTHCSSLKTISKIPTTVIHIEEAFSYCTTLEGNIKIDSNPENYFFCFYNTVKPITITGSCSSETKANLAATSLNGNVNY